MKKGKNWPLLAAALAMMVLTWADTDLSVLMGLAIQDMAPVLIITAAVCLLKTGALAAVLMGLKKLWNWLKNAKTGRY